MNEARLKNKDPYRRVLTRVNEMKRKCRDILFLRYWTHCKIASQTVQSEARYQSLNMELHLTTYSVSKMRRVIFSIKMKNVLFQEYCGKPRFHLQQLCGQANLAQFVHSATKSSAPNPFAFSCVLRSVVSAPSD